MTSCEEPKKAENKQLYNMFLIILYIIQPEGKSL